MRWISAVAVGRRRRWAVVLAAVVLLGVAAPLGTRFQNAQKNDPASFLPGGAESVRSLEQQRTFRSGTQTPAVTVMRRAGGLTAADRAAIQRFATGLAERPNPSGGPVVSATLFPRRFGRIGGDAADRR